MDEKRQVAMGRSGAFLGCMVGHSGGLVWDGKEGLGRVRRKAVDVSELTDGALLVGG
jgi:hypothetical protein